MSSHASAAHIKWFKEINIEDVPSVGGKNASLGEMYQVRPVAGQAHLTGVQRPQSLCSTSNRPSSYSPLALALRRPREALALSLPQLTSGPAASKHNRR